MKQEEWLDLCIYLGSISIEILKFLEKKEYEHANEISDKLRIRASLEVDLPGSSELILKADTYAEAKAYGLYSNIIMDELRHNPSLYDNEGSLTSLGKSIRDVQHYCLDCLKEKNLIDPWMATDLKKKSDKIINIRKYGQKGHKEIDDEQAAPDQ